MKKKFEYTIHNIIAHPLMEIFHLVGLTQLGNKIHDKTLPKRTKRSYNHERKQKTDME